MEFVEESLTVKDELVLSATFTWYHNLSIISLLFPGDMTNCTVVDVCVLLSNGETCTGVDGGLPATTTVVN